MIGFLVPLAVIIGVELTIAAQVKKKRRQFSHDEDLEESGREPQKRAFWERYSPYANLPNLLAGFLLAPAINQVRVRLPSVTKPRDTEPMTG